MASFNMPLSSTSSVDDGSNAVGISAMPTMHSQEDDIPAVNSASRPRVDEERGFLNGTPLPTGNMDADSTPDISEEELLDDILAWIGQERENLGADNSTNSDVMAEIFREPYMQRHVAPDATLNGLEQQSGQNGAGNGAYSNAAPQHPVAPHATLNGFGQQPEQMRFDNSAYFNAAPQYPVHPPMDHNGNQLPYYAPVDCAMQQYVVPEGNAAAHARLPQPAPKRRRVAGPRAGTRQPAAAAEAGPSTRPAIAGATPEQQPAPVERALYERTAKGVPNTDPSKKGNEQGQTQAWCQGTKHHRQRCNAFVPNGCIADCMLQKTFPETCEKWARQRFQIQWKPASPEHLETEVVSGMFVYSRSFHPDTFVVLGEIDPGTHQLNKKSKTVHRVDKAPQ